MTKTSLRRLTYKQLADVVRDIADEVMRRDSIFVHTHVTWLLHSAGLLDQISAGEKRNPTSACGPIEK